MSRKTMVYISLMIIIIILFTGCGSIRKKKQLDDKVGATSADSHDLDEKEDSDEEIRDTLLYYQDDNGYLVPVVRKIPWEEGIAKAAISKMMDTDEQQIDFMAMGLKPILPASTVINGLSVNDGLAKLDLNKDVMERANAVDEYNMIHGTAMALCEFPAIDRVQFLFDGEIIDKLPHGTDVSGPIVPEDLNLEMGESSRIDGEKVTVFYHNRSSSQYKYLVPITRISSFDSMTLENAINELLTGPNPDSGLEFDIPLGTRLLGVQIEGNSANINLSNEFESLADHSENEDIVLRSIYMTIKEFSGIEDVNILVDGKGYGAKGVSVPTFINQY
ncbi:MAG: hypothetical protein GX974_07010 [Clostridiales bacterium]|nr:hypothetical protein [Clostridiales bacterium]